MRSKTAIIISISVVLLILIGLSAARFVTLDRPQETELAPDRSSYNSGPTGTRAFYQLLEESGYPVARWRSSYLELEKQAGNDLLVTIDPWQIGQGQIGQGQIAPGSSRPIAANGSKEQLCNPTVSTDEMRALQRWVAHGSTVLVISRLGELALDQPGVQIIPADVTPETPINDLIDTGSARTILQPSTLTRGLERLTLSRLAGRKNTARESAPSEEESDLILYAPVIHLGDAKGAILVDYQYGKGRFVFLSDPFPVSNHGISRGSNLELALNLVSLPVGTGEPNSKRILFDEYHHGFRQETTSSLLAFSRGTVLPWIALQGILVGIFILYSRSRRFARPIPLPVIDRGSPLEFVGSMANLQQTAQAHDLAMETIYPRFRARICHRIGLSPRDANDKIIRRLSQLRIPASPNLSLEKIESTLIGCEMVLHGATIDDERLVELISNLRRIQHELFRSNI